MRTHYVAFITTLLLFLAHTTIWGQVRKADHLYGKMDFAGAAHHYEKALQKTDNKIPVLTRLIDCYYNIYEYEKGIFYGKQLLEYEEVSMEPSKHKEFHFKYAQLLAATTHYDESLFHLNQYRAASGLAPIESDDVLEVFKLKSPRYALNKVKFNTNASEFGAFKSNGFIYFISDQEIAKGKKYSWTKRNFLDLLRIDEAGYERGRPKLERMPSPINSEWHDGPFCFSKDGNTIYFTRNDTDKRGKIKLIEGKNTLQLYTSNKTKKGWSVPKKLSFCKSEHNYMHPSLDEKNGTLYFSSDIPDGIGGYDIYKVKIDKEAHFGPLVNLGANINTPAREQFPYIAEDGDLFFSSNGHMGFGLLDVYVAHKENNTYGNPINLGTPINSKYEDFSFIEYEDGKGFFSTNRNNANDQIYEFVQIEPWDKPQDEIVDVVEELPLQSSPSDDLAMELDKNQDFKIITQQKNKLLLEMEPIRFRFNRWEVDDKSRKIILGLAEKLRHYNNITLRISAHTDKIGPDWYNQNLSEKRAEAVKQVLLEVANLSPEQITTQGMGESNPIFDCEEDCTAWMHYKNRRCEFEITFDTLVAAPVEE